MLEEFADAIEEHNAHGLGIHADGKSGHSRQTHQEILIENLSMGNVFRGGQENACAQDQVADDEYGQGYDDSDAHVA